MPYQILADADHPAFIIYLIDMSGSMEMPCGRERRIDVVANAMQATLRRMISRSLIGDEIRPRYAVAMLGYSNSTFDLIGGVKTIDELETWKPQFKPQGGTNTASAFQAALDTLEMFLPNVDDCPAPLVCHLTDGAAPAAQNDQIEALAREIKSKSNMDGNVLLENIYIGERLMRQPIDPYTWQGVHDPAEVVDEDARRLWYISSPLPKSYADVLRGEEYCMQEGAKMLIPAEAPEMIELAFAMSGATGAAGPLNRQAASSGDF